MNMSLNETVLLQIGISALVIVFLYRLHRLVEGFDRDDRQRLMRQRDARRWLDQEWLATLKILSDSRFISQSMVGSEGENTLTGLDEMRVSISIAQAQEVSSRMLGRMEYSIVGEPAFQHISVGVPLGEELLR